MELLTDVDIGNTFLNHPAVGGFLTQNSDIGTLISNLLSNALVFAGLLLLIYMIIGGIGIMSSAGSGNEEKMEKGKKALTSAVTGFIVVFAAYWIVQLISTVTGTNIIP